VTPATTVAPVEALLTAPERGAASDAYLLAALAQAAGTRFIPKVQRGSKPCLMPGCKKLATAKTTASDPMVVAISHVP